MNKDGTAIFEGFADQYQDGQLDAALDDVFALAAQSGTVLLAGESRPYAPAKGGPYALDDLLLPFDSDKWPSMAQAYAGLADVYPDWFTYDDVRRRFIFTQNDLIDAFIRAHKLTRQGNQFIADGYPVDSDSIKEMLSNTLAIVHPNPGSLIYGYFQALKTRCKSETTDAPAPDLQTPVEAFDSFMAKIQTDAYRPIQTGMPAFDRLLRGGIPRQSFVILSAAPRVGKTTLTQQIFEAAAAQGTDVIFTNLEMSREQLLARSLSRMIYYAGGSISASDIMRGYAWTETQRRYIEAAAAKYRAEIAPRMHYNPNTGTSLTAIMEALTYAAMQAKAAGRPAPVAVIDYLHLITADGREEQSEVIKRAVATLKRWAIEYDTFVFAISANNRTSNNSPKVSIDSSRDTSAIEYTADILIGMNYKKIHDGIVSPDDPDAIETLQKEKPCVMMCQVLKNRMCEPGGKLYLNYYGESSVFIPVEDRITAPPARQQSVNEFTPVDDPNNPFI